jgi:hypothetical protein
MDSLAQVNSVATQAVTRQRGRPRRAAIAKENLVGARNIALISRHLERLRAANSHPNRLVHMDNLLVALLYAFYNPTCRSLRTLEGLSQIDVVKNDCGINKLCRSTTSDAMAFFDASLLLPLLDEVRKQVPALKRADLNLDTIVRQVIAADGSYLNLYADVAWAIHLTRRDGSDSAQMRLNFQLRVLDEMPISVSISGAESGSETAAVAKEVLPDAIYVADRNFVDMSFFNAVLEKRSDFVVRAKDNAPNFEEQQQLPLSLQDQEHGVLSDKIGILPGRGGPQRQLRQIVISDIRTKKNIRIITSLLDTPAYIIGVIYRYRWKIELFFRWLKVWANFEHLISHSRNGLTIQFYVAVIGVLLMYASTGRRVSKYAFSLLGFVASGQTTLEKILPILEQREREKQLERLRLAKKKTQKTVN